MILLTAYTTLLPDKVAAALDACRTVREPSLLEAGCERYDYFQSPDDGTRIVFVEEWTTKAALDLHFQTEHFQLFMAALADCLQGPPEVKIFDAVSLD